MRRAAAADEGDAPTAEVGRAGVDVAGHGFRGAGRDCFILSVNNIAETQPFEQFVGGGMSQAEGLMSPWSPVVGLQRVDRIQSQLCRPREPRA